MGITTNIDYIVIKSYKRFIALRVKISSLTVQSLGINLDGWKLLSKEEREVFKTSCEKLGRYKSNLSVTMKELEDYLREITKKVKHRKSKYLNNIIAIFNNGCRCLPLEDDTFCELPKCMEEILDPISEHTYDARAADLTNEPDNLWIEANKPRTM